MGQLPSLFIASQLGNEDVVKQLLAHPKIEVNKRRTYVKDNAINIAAYRGHLEVVKLLLRCPKVILGVKDKNDKTELDHAKEKGYHDIVDAIQSRPTLLQQGHTC